MAKRPNKIDAITWVLLIIVLISNILSIFSSVCSRNEIPAIVKNVVDNNTQKVDYAKINQSIDARVAEKIKALNITQPKDGKDSVSTVEKTTETVIKETAVKGDQGVKGNTGDSAYDIAVKNGYEGTIKDWLISLKGNSGLDGLTPIIRCNTTKNRWEVRYTITDSWKALNNEVVKCTSN